MIVKSLTWSNLRKKLNSSKLLQLFKNSFYYGLGSLVQRFLSVILLPIYTRYLTPEDYGIIALATIFMTILTTITMSGLTNGISRYFYYSEKYKITRDEVVSSPLFFVLIISSLSAIFLVNFSEHLSRFLFDSARHSNIIELIAITTLFSNIFTIGQSVLIFEERVWTVNFITIINVLIGAISGIILVAYLDRGVSGVYEASLITTILTSVIVFFVALRRYKFKYNYPLLLKQLRFSMPLMVAVFCFFFIDSSDRYMLKLFVPLSEVGLYNIGYQFGLLMMLFVGGFSAAWPPYYHKNNQNDEGQTICAEILTSYLVIALPLTVILSFVSPIIINILTPNSFHSSYTIVPYVALAYMLKGPYIIFLMGLIMKNKTSWQLYLEAFAAIVNILLNFALIPIIGREAAAITTLISYAIMAVGSYILVNRINPINNIEVMRISIFIIIGAMFSISSLLFFSNEYNALFVFIPPVLFLLIVYFFFKRNFDYILSRII